MKFLREYTISTHAPAGGATLIIGSVDTEVVTFLLTPLREGRPEQRRGLLLAQAFLLTPLREGRRQTFQYHQYLGFISTHAPAGVATTISWWITQAASYFYSRPCGRGDLQAPEGVSDVPISTHAPAGGATILSFFWEPGIKVSALSAQTCSLVSSAARRRQNPA